MLTRDTILELMHGLNDELATGGVVGEVLLCGEAIMCLVFQARQATKDVDAVFTPVGAIRDGARTVARRHGAPEDWLNDAAKAFFSGRPPQQQVLDLPNLRVWAPTPEYMLAMKCVAARFDSLDRQDVAFLIRLLDLRATDEALDIVARFYPRRLVPARAQFLIEELMDGLSGERQAK
ncbi:MAG: hypothetical protein FJX72_12390 [Armatimonadetes bacterium]|nr:hypothetical protein [Armatimonadota bacterium]